jgi:hypothetical protein
MAVRNVTLNYGPEVAGHFGPDPKEVHVRAGDVIRFRRGAKNPPNTRIRITLKQGEGVTEQVISQSFSAAQVLHGKGADGNGSLDLEIRSELNGKVSYRCELLDQDDHLLAESEGGGEIVPDTGGGE